VLLETKQKPCGPTAHSSSLLGNLLLECVSELRAELSLSFPVPDGRDESKRHHPSPGEEREPRKSVSYGGWGEELHTGAHPGDRPLPGRLRLRHRRRAPPQHGTEHTPASCFLFPFASCIHNQQSSRKHRAPLGRAEIWGWIFTLVLKIPAIWFSTKGFATSFFLKKIFNNEISKRLSCYPSPNRSNRNSRTNYSTAVATFCVSCL